MKFYSASAGLQTGTAGLVIIVVGLPTITCGVSTLTFGDGWLRIITCGDGLIFGAIDTDGYLIPFWLITLVGSL